MRRRIRGVGTRGALPRLRGRGGQGIRVGYALDRSTLYVANRASLGQSLASRFSLIRHQPCSPSGSQARQRSTGGDPLQDDALTHTQAIA